jgi:ribosomal protein S18 acetylase RimI-like enzyme
MLATCQGFELCLDREIATRVEEFEGGYAVIDTGIPRVWSASYIVLEPGGHMDAGRIVELGDELFGAAGMNHRSVKLLDLADAERLRPELAALGWEPQRTMYLAWRRPPDREAETQAAEVDPDSLADIHKEISRVEDGEDEEVGLQLLEREKRLGKIAGGRWFAAQRDGELAGCCVLYRRDGTGQVEAVSTSPRHRNHGLARAIVLAAAGASRDAGDSLTFIAADADDWPLKLYQRLGFDPVGTTMGFLRKPPPAGD